MPPQRQKSTRMVEAVIAVSDGAGGYTEWDGDVSIPPGSVTVDSQPQYIKLVDEASPTITYVGEAMPGASAAAASWRIKRIDTSVLDAEVLYADGNTDFDNIWNARTEKSYS